MPTYYFMKIFFFDCANIVVATIIIKYLVHAEKNFPCKSGKKNYLKNSNMTPLNFLKILFRKFHLLNAPGMVFAHFQIKYHI